MMFLFLLCILPFVFAEDCAQNCLEESVAVIRDVLPTAVFLSNGTFEEERARLASACTEVEKGLNCAETCDDGFSSIIVDVLRNNSLIGACDKLVDDLSNTWIKCFVENRPSFIEHCGGRESVESMQASLEATIDVAVQVLDNITLIIDPNFLYALDHMCGNMVDFLKCAGDNALDVCREDAKNGIEALVEALKSVDVLNDESSESSISFSDDLNNNGTTVKYADQCDQLDGELKLFAMKLGVQL